MSQIYFYDLLSQKTKVGCLNLTYHLFNRNLNSKYHLYSGKYGEPLNQESIFYGIYRRRLQPVVMKLYKSYRINYFWKGWGSVDVKF